MLRVMRCPDDQLCLDLLDVRPVGKPKAGSGTPSDMKPAPAVTRWIPAARNEVVVALNRSTRAGQDQGMRLRADEAGQMLVQAVPNERGDAHLALLMVLGATQCRSQPSVEQHDNLQGARPKWPMWVIPGDTAHLQRCLFLVYWRGFVIRRRFIVPMLVSGAVALAGGWLPASATSTSVGKTGYDVSWPQCTGTNNANSSLTGPAMPGQFAILGVNGGKPDTPNPCLASQVAQAPKSLAPVSYYQNTALPSSRSADWPANPGIFQEKPCASQKRYTEPNLSACAYDYGWNAAAYGVSRATQAVSTTQWWLDVESANSWSSDTAANTADLHGAVDYLKTAVGETNIGFYTNSSSWSSITAGTSEFQGYAFWAPGLVSNPTDAQVYCTSGRVGVTGGRIRYLQWTATYDMDYDCG